MVSDVRTMRSSGRHSAIISIMRKPLEIPDYLIKQCELYAPGHASLDAVCHVLQDYPRVVGDLRQLRRRVADLDSESGQLDDLVSRLKGIAAEIQDL